MRQELSRGRVLWSQLSLCRSPAAPAGAPCPAMPAAEATGAAETLETDKFPMEKLTRIISRGHHPLGKDRIITKGMSSNS